MATARPAPIAQRRLPLVLELVLGLALLLGGCASQRPPSAPKPAVVSDERAAFAANLAVEQRWLDSWFRGTPVVIAQNDEGELIVEVPREFCFEAGRSRVRPALAAVLDKVAESLRRRPTAQLNLLAAPDDKTAAGALALERATQVQKHLRERGVRSAQLGVPTAGKLAAVQLHIGPEPAH